MNNLRNQWLSVSLVFLTFLSCYLIAANDGINVPCSPRRMNQSVICVCNATYCDELYKEPPLPSGSFRTYTSSKAGKRYKKSLGSMRKARKKMLLSFHARYYLDVNSTYQTILGFGGSVSDAAAMNWLNLDNATQERLINAFFGPGGSEYHFVRTAIGGTDFSTRPYSLDDGNSDKKLLNFSLTSEDYDYKIPMLKRIQELTVNELDLIATCWSPPPWMKTNNNYTGPSLLYNHYYQTYADYHIRFLREYAKNGINFWGITTTNQPMNGLILVGPTVNCLGFPAEDQADWIVNNFGPTLRGSEFKDINVLALDDQRYALPGWIDDMVTKNEDVLDYIDGIALHYYGDSFSPPELLEQTHEKYPQKFLINTEACTGNLPSENQNVSLGSWRRAERYALDIIEDLNYWVTGWMDWNLALDMEGGPSWSSNYVDAAVIVPDNGTEFYKQPIYYALGHFSKFIPRGSVRVNMQWNFGLAMDNVAVRRPDGSFCIVIMNTGGPRTFELDIRHTNQQMILHLDANSLTTVELYL